VEPAAGVAREQDGLVEQAGQQHERPARERRGQLARVPDERPAPTPHALALRLEPARVAVELARRRARAADVRIDRELAGLHG